MKRILFISPRLSSGGAERQSVTVARALKERGYEVEFLCYSYGNFYEELLKRDGINVYWIQHNYVLRLITCSWFIRKRKYDIVISFLPTPCFINSFAAMFGKKWKVITGERSSVVNKPNNLLGRFKIWVLRYSDFIVCNSNNANTLWRQTFPQYKEKLVTIYNTIALPAVSSAYAPLNDGRLHIIVAATIYGTKNPLGLIRALGLMTFEEREKIVIDWYGKSEAEIGNHKVYDEACQLISEMKLHDTLIFHDAVKDISEKMQQSDAVALFSRLEGLPNAICEGMALGKPIIMTRCSDYENLVEEGVNGVLCNWDNPETIKTALLYMASLDKEQLVAMGNNSKQKAEILFSEEKVIGQWLELISD